MQQLQSNDQMTVAFELSPAARLFFLQSLEQSSSRQETHTAHCAVCSGPAVVASPTDNCVVHNCRLRLCGRVYASWLAALPCRRRSFQTQATFRTAEFRAHRTYRTRSLPRFGTAFSLTPKSDILAYQSSDVWRSLLQPMILHNSRMTVCVQRGADYSFPHDMYFRSRRRIPSMCAFLHARDESPSRGGISFQLNR